MNILSKRLKGGHLTGRITVNGQKCSSTAFKKFTAYVMQDDSLLGMTEKQNYKHIITNSLILNFLGNLSARELLRYTAELKLPRDMSRKVRPEFY